MKPSDFQKTVQCRFESCLKKVVRSVVKDYYKELNRRKNKEISFSELPDVLVDKMAVWDDYETDYTIFSVYIGRNLMSLSRRYGIINIAYTAFKRRWNFEYLGINENEEKISGMGKIELAGSDEPVEWNILRRAINAKMSSDQFKINEDKLMGPFFLSKKVIASDENGMIVDTDKFVAAFKSKVIMYLYEDAVKQGKHRFFDGCDNSKYSSVCDAFDEIGMGIFGSNFKENFYDKQKDEA